MSPLLDVPLSGVKHNLLEGQIVYVGGYGGTGPAVAAFGFIAAQEVLQAIDYRKFGNDVSPTQALLELAEKSHTQPSRIIMGVAAPVENNSAPAGVHTRYAVSGQCLQEPFPACSGARVWNDYGLLGWRLQTRVPHERRQVLQRGLRQTQPADRISCIGPGSGLGTVRLINLPGGHHLIEELEAGHAPLVTASDVTTQKVHGKLKEWWETQYGTVNSDVVLCGSGLLKLLRYLVSVHQYPLHEDLGQLMNEERDDQPDLAHQDHVLLTDYALLKNDPTCSAAIDIFMELLGCFAQTAAFFHTQRDLYYRIYLGGGVLARLLKDQFFMRRHGRHFIQKFVHTRVEADSRWLQSIPVDFLLDPRAEALHGAAIAAACMELS